MFDQTIIIIRGGGDLATGTAFRLHQSGFPVIVLELAWPLVVRRKVSLAAAVFEDQVEIEGLIGRRVPGLREALPLSLTGVIPVVASPQLPDLQGAIQDFRERKGAAHSIEVLIDARMAKRNIDTVIDQAPTVIALGPGFTAGHDCHAVIETMRGHRLGRVIWNGPALANTGAPGLIDGHSADRVLRAPTEGVVRWEYQIGNRIEEGMTLGWVEQLPVIAPFSGVIRGLIMPGTAARLGQKIGDIDSRADIDACFTISDKALSIGGGVLEAILARMGRGKWSTIP